MQRVADDVGYSRRHLATLVRAECGLTPEGGAAARPLRGARERLLGTAPASLRWRPRCGYADQAHLTREWVALAGCTPTTWLREEFPFLQDLPVGAGSG